MATLDIEFRARRVGSVDKQISTFGASLGKVENIINSIDFSKFIKNINEVGTAFRTATKDVNDFGKALNNSLKSGGNSTIDALKASTQSYRTELARLKAENQQLRNDLQANNKAIADSKLAYEQGRSSQQSYRTEVSRLKVEIEKLRLAKAQNRQQTIAASGSYREAQQRLTALGNTIRNTEGGFTRLTPALRAQITEYRRLNEQLKAFDRAMGNHQRNVGNYSSAFLGSLPVIGQFTTAIGLATVAYQGLQKSFRTNLKLDALDYSMKQISENALKFDSTMNYLRTTSERLGLDFVSTVEAFKQWDAAARYSNLTGEETMQIFDSVANAGARLKLSNEQVQGTFLALSQMLSKGVVSMEELRRQLGDRIPGAFQIAAKGMGMTEAELNKLVSTGKLASDEFLPKFAAELDKAFGNDKKEKIESLQASVNRLNTEFDMLFKSERMTKFFTVVSDGFARMAKEINFMVNSKDWEEFKAIAFGGLDEHRKYVNNRDLTEGQRYLKNIQFENKSVQKQKDIVEGLTTTLQAAVRKKNEFFKSSESEGISINEATRRYEALGQNVKFYSDALAEANKILYGSGVFDKKGAKTVLDDTKKTAKAAQDYLNAVQLLSQKTDFSLEIAETEGLDSLLAKNKQKYKKYLDELDALEKKNRTGKNVTNRTETQSLIDTTRNKILENQEAEANQIRIKYAKETAETIDRLYDEAGVRRDASRQRDLQNNEVYYNKLRQQHQENADILNAIDVAQKVAREQINAKWDGKALEEVSKLQDKIRKVEETPFKSGQGVEEVRKELDKRLKQIEDFYKQIYDILNKNGLSAEGLNMVGSFEIVTNAANEASSELSRYMKGTFRRSISSALNGMSRDIVSSFQSMYDIENKYAQLREGASAEQIKSLNKMMRLEKQINNGLSNMFISLSNGLSSIGGGMLTGALSDGIAKGKDPVTGESFSQLKNLFKGDNKIMGYGSLASILGGVLTNLTPSTSTAGKALGGALSGVGTGAMLGSIIPGLGTAIGAAIGGLIGAIGGLLGAGSARKQRELQEAQLAEQRKQTALMERQQALAFTSSIIGQRTNQGIVTGVDRNAFGDITFEIEGRKLKAVMDKENAAQGRGIF